MSSGQYRKQLRYCNLVSLWYRLALPSGVDTMKTFFPLLILGLIGPVSALAGDDHRQVMKIDREVRIVPAGTAPRGW